MVDLFARLQFAVQLKSGVERIRKTCHRLGFKWELRVWQESTGQEMVVGSGKKMYLKPPKPIEIVIISNKPVPKPEEKTQQEPIEASFDSRGSTTGSV